MSKVKSICGKFIDFIVLFISGGVALAKRKGVKVGTGCRLYIRNWGTEPFLIELGDSVTVTSGVKFITHDGSTCLVFDDFDKRYQYYNRIKVGNNVFIGVNSIILPGVEIGSNVVVGAGSVVTKSIPSDSVAVGVPAKVVGTFEKYSEKIRNSCVSNSDLEHIHNYKTRVLTAISKQKDM